MKIFTSLSQVPEIAELPQEQRRELCGAFRFWLWRKKPFLAVALLLLHLAFVLLLAQLIRRVVGWSQSTALTDFLALLPGVLIGQLLRYHIECCFLRPEVRKQRAQSA